MKNLNKTQISYALMRQHIIENVDSITDFVIKSNDNSIEELTQSWISNKVNYQVNLSQLMNKIYEFCKIDPLFSNFKFRAEASVYDIKENIQPHIKLTIDCDFYVSFDELNNPERWKRNYVAVSIEINLENAGSAFEMFKEKYMIIRSQKTIEIVA